MVGYTALTMDICSRLCGNSFLHVRPQSSSMFHSPSSQPRGVAVSAQGSRCCNWSIILVMVDLILVIVDRGYGAS
eukprot:CFRG7544T1